ncbi:MAG: GAF domain-containing protein, partial [Ilumatobacteraceae bacterium]
MTRESDLARTLVELADSLVDDFDIVDLLTTLTDRCVRVLGVAAAGIMLIDAEGQLRLMTSSSAAMRVVELFELQAQEGPCLECYRTGQPVVMHDLDAPGGRWPRFAAVATGAG